MYWLNILQTIIFDIVAN